ncbi:MAG: S41 family peptidase [Thermoguttaceae bacterium]
MAWSHVSFFCKLGLVLCVTLPVSGVETSSVRFVMPVEAGSQDGAVSSSAVPSGSGVRFVPPRGTVREQTEESLLPSQFSPSQQLQPLVPPPPTRLSPTRPASVAPEAVASPPVTGATQPESLEESVRRVLADAEPLERSSRWGELLQYYEASLRAYQHHPDIFARYHIARYHYDVNRRYHDASFIDELKNRSFDAFLKHYREVMMRLQTSHLTAPTWDAIFQAGFSQLTISLGEEAFRSAHSVTRSNDELAAVAAPYRNIAPRSLEEVESATWQLAQSLQREAGVPIKATFFEMLAGAANSLDPYTAYLTRGQLEDSNSMISGQLVGIGVELTSDRESLIVLRVISGSPAKEAGLCEGDRILAVNDQTTQHRDTDRAADLLQGVAGSVAKLTIRSRSGITRTVSMVRRRVEVPSVEDIHMLSSSLGYVKLTCFQMRTVTELRDALWSLYRQGMTCLVLDLRHNPGGLLPVCIEAVDLFIDKGVIVRTAHPGGIETPYLATEPGTWQVPLIVLIDQDSASAAEIFAGAIRDHHRGLIVGCRSFGKDSVQAIHPFFDRDTNPPTKIGGLRVTTENFFSPNGLPFTGVGVTPDVVVGDSDGRIVVARPIDGAVPPPRYPSSAPDDPCIREAITLSARLTPVPVAQGTR